MSEGMLSDAEFDGIVQYLKAKGVGVHRFIADRDARKEELWRVRQFAKELADIHAEELGRYKDVARAARDALIVSGMTPSKLPSQWQAVSVALSRLPEPIEEEQE